MCFCMSRPTAPQLTDLAPATTLGQRLQEARHAHGLLQALIGDEQALALGVITSMRHNVLIVGSVGAGKTLLAHALLARIPTDSRLAYVSGDGDFRECSAKWLRQAVAPSAYPSAIAAAFNDSGDEPKALIVDPLQYGGKRTIAALEQATREGVQVIATCALPKQHSDSGVEQLPEIAAGAARLAGTDLSGLARIFDYLVLIQRDSTSPATDPPSFRATLRRLETEVKLVEFEEGA